MTITAEDLNVPDALLARRVLAHARVIAPCLQNLADDDREDAIAILQGVAREAMARGTRSVVSQSVGTARVSYGSATTWFTDDDRDALRVLCPAVAASVASAGHPVGRFPKPTRFYKSVWPEEE